ncbi:unnamed protein product [Owenia fusiformis]|uniref:Uncharacterized protein n=1 Tax=Owenia fusiformis TaxID=6347 RepID=A0A8S4P7V7_OWEFU|nr:unnamed protein product [Owenia fusiformis]
MAMNYVGNIAILDRGDAPAQVVIDKNARSLAQRVADDTREELDRVMGRVEHIYDDLDAADKLQQNTRLSSMEYLSDVFELEELLKDQVKKKKYQQQVTVFVIGFQNVAGTKLKLLQQVNDFFMDSSQQMEEEDLATPTPEFNLDEVAENMASTIDTAQDLSKKLGEINHEMVEYLTSVSATKAGNRGKRKLEKALGAAKEDIQKLTDNLLAAQQELEDREEKMQQLFKQIEGKSMEVNKFKTAAEVARKAAAEADLLQDELEKRDKRITEMRRKIADLELEVGQVSYSREQTQGRMSKANTHGKEKIESLQTALDDKINELAINKKELQNLHEQQTEELTKDHAETIEKMKQDHAEEIRKLMGSMIEQNKESSRNTSRAESRPKPGSRGSNKGKSPSRPNTKSSSVSPARKPQRSKSEIATQDDGDGPNSGQVVRGPPTRGSQQHTNLDTVDEDYDINVEDLPDILNEDAWAVPKTPQDLKLKYAQHRLLSKHKLAELGDDVEAANATTQRKVKTLKVQFQEHKAKWSKEREILIEQIEQLQKLQNEAEHEADEAMNQLETFIDEQEKLEKEEEKLRDHVMSRSGMTKISLDEAKSSLQTTLDANAKSDLDLQERLMQQTDDAKAEEMANKLANLGRVKSEPEVKASPTEEEEISGTNEDEIRASSVLSRVSLRDQFKNHLDAQRSMTAERRSNTPAIDVESYKSTVLNEELDENADIPFTEEEGTATMSFHKGTSPPPGSTMMSSSQHAPSLHSKASSRKSLSIAEHPVVNEYIKTYDVVINFKDTLSKLFLDKDMMSLAEILADLDPVMFNREIKVQPQIEMMTSSVLKVLEEITSLISSILFNDRDYNVSSLLNVSRDPTRTLDAGSTHGSLKSGKSVATTDDVRELRDAYFEIEKRLEEQRRRYEEQNSHNTVLMMEMQDTINQLQREISTIDKERQDQKEATSSPEPSIMFTRLDVERNTKVIKRAGDEGRLPNAVIQDAVKNMEDYSSLPARRLVHLVQKYVHHCQMKDIEENVRKSRSLNDNVFMILDKMESLQNKRAQKWADRMDEMGSERLRLANLLMETLNGIEQESGIFLIKPMYSYKARALTDKYQAKVSQKAYRPPRELSPLPGHGRHSQQSHLAPAPTPSSNARGYNKSDKVMSEERKASPDDPGAGILGAAPNWVGEQPTSSWNPGASEAAELPDEHLFRINNLMNTPKILEMDVNRMLIGQNNISAKIIGGSPTSIASNLRSYVSVQRQPQNGPIKKDHLRPKSTGGIDSSAAPPTTPMRDSLPQSAASMKRARFSDMDGHVSKSLPNTPPPLPPITRQSTKSSDLPVPPASPPGSSLRQSPPIMNDDDDIIPSHVTKVIATSSKGELTLDNMNPET